MTTRTAFRNTGSRKAEGASPGGTSGANWNRPTRPSRAPPVPFPVNRFGSRQVRRPSPVGDGGRPNPAISRRSTGRSRRSPRHPCDGREWRWPGSVPRSPGGAGGGPKRSGPAATRETSEHAVSPVSTPHGPRRRQRTFRERSHDGNMQGSTARCEPASRMKPIHERTQSHGKPSLFS